MYQSLHLKSFYHLNDIAYITSLLNFSESILMTDSTLMIQSLFMSGLITYARGIFISKNEFNIYLNYNCFHETLGHHL